MYAIVKKVVTPARSSMENLEPLIALGCFGLERLLFINACLTYMTRPLEVEITPNDGVCHKVVETVRVTINNAHDCGGSVTKGRKEEW